MPFPTCLPGKLTSSFKTKIKCQNSLSSSIFPFLCIPIITAMLLLNHPIAVIAPCKSPCLFLPPSHSFSILQSISKALLVTSSSAHILHWLPMVPRMEICNVAHVNRVDRSVSSLRCSALPSDPQFWGVVLFLTSWVCANHVACARNALLHHSFSFPVV